MIQQCGIIGTQELFMILIAVVLLFGGKKIPELAKGLGKGIHEFKKATQDEDFVNDLKDVASEVSDLKRDVEKIHPKNILKDATKIKEK
ncbi:MAG: twin-arginine translocase TatA/TatE family subunit [Bacteroidales bacterium]|nr:twin-arginine translocase TatA/TatE family subunit [Bacteroidales bacterium]